MKNLKAKILFLIIFTLSGIGIFLYANDANAIALTVKRVIFEGPKRAEVITVINNSNNRETYRLGWKNMYMSETKGLKSIPEGEAFPVDLKPSKDMVRFSPRRFTLEAGGSQQVRMMLRTPSGLEDGEYRSHFYVRPEGDVEAFREQVKRKANSNKPGAFMKMLAGVSMPIFVRKGDLYVEAGIEELSAVNNGNNVDVRFSVTRQGTRSSYGDLDYICNKGSNDEYLLRFTRGFSIYTETPRRSLNLRLPKKLDKPACNSLTLRYTETDGVAGKMLDVLAEETVQVQ